MTPMTALYIGGGLATALAVFLGVLTVHAFRTSRKK